MFCRHIPAILLFLALTFPAQPAFGARAAEPDPAAFLPPEATVLQTAQGDVNGDGRDDVVALYGIANTRDARPQRAGLLVVLATDADPRPVHLFGEPPYDLRGEPNLGPDSTSDLALRDLTGDGITEIVVTVTNRSPNASPKTVIWVFGAGEEALPPAADDDQFGPLPPTWAGTGFRALAYLEGDRVEIDASAEGGPSTLYQEESEHLIGGPDPIVTRSETFTWRNDGFRLAERSLTLPEASVGADGSPEAAVLSYYGALGRGDAQAATDFLGDELRASRSEGDANDPAAPGQEIRVEEVRLLDDYLSRRTDVGAERLVYVRASMLDAPTEPSPDDGQNRRRTVAGTWRTALVGDQWRLVESDLHETADLAALTDQLPAGISLLQTAGGDLRGQVVEDIAVLVTGLGRFALVEPYIIYAGSGGLEPAVPVASYVSGGLPGGPFGVIRMEDVNGDGRLELSYNGIAGAHSALLWVLQWDGTGLVPLFNQVSNARVIGLEDLDGDGISEVLMVQSGYCGSYASSPTMAFAFRWEQGAYQPASWHYPSLQDGIDDRAEDATTSRPDDPSVTSERACIQHMLATANAFRGRPADARIAYRKYANLRQQTPVDSRTFLRPIYLGAPYVEDDLRAVLAAAESGESPGWTPADLAILHDLLGDALLSRAQNHQAEAEDEARNNRADQEQEAHRKASEARQAATREYQAALALDPTDEEARRMLDELTDGSQSLQS